MGKHILFLIFIILFACSLLAQQGKQYVFSRYNTGNGLASNYVNNLVQDQQGFIWLATINGLHKYDGHKFTTFKHETNNPATVPSDNIAEVYGDARNNLWVSTADNKVGIFNTHTFIYKEISIKSNAISTIYTVKRFSKPGPGS